MEALAQLKEEIQKRKGKREQLEQEIDKLKSKLSKDRKHLKSLDKAKAIVDVVALKTQEQLSFHISDIASLAMESIFPDAYALLLEFVQRRNKTECDIVFEKDGEQFHPLTASGGGTVDVAAFALRIASWSMENPRTRPIIVLDEPMKYVSAEYQEAASEMIKQISKKLGIQFLIVTHLETLASHADKEFKTTIKNGKTKIKEV